MQTKKINIVRMNDKIEIIILVKNGIIQIIKRCYKVVYYIDVNV